MDVAYDHTFTDEVVTTPDGKGKTNAAGEESLNEELQQAYKAISNSPWGARFGAFVGTVRKQGESYYETARKEYPSVAEHAAKGLGELRTNIVARTRGLSLSGGSAPAAATTTSTTTSTEKGKGKEHEESLLEKIKKGASQRIAEIEAAEARADEYLLKFGASIGGFLRDAVTIAPPAETADGKEGEVVFEVRAEGEKKMQVFMTRLDAQLHLLHSNLELFKTDPKVESFKDFKSTFSIDKQTERISVDLEKYPGLRATMEKLVPGEVEYAPFWIRYYFLRNELDLEEKKRKELLQGASIVEEEVGWDEDDSSDEDDEDDDDDDESDEESGNEDKQVPANKKPISKASTDTLQPATKPKTSIDRSSQPDSDASYDVVSGAPSMAPSQSAGSPPKSKVKDDSSDEEADWE